MKKVIVIFFLFDFIQRIISSSCHRYSYDSSLKTEDNKTYICVDNDYVIHPCSNNTICPFKLGSSEIDCVSKESVSSNSFFDSYIDNLFVNRRLDVKEKCNNDTDCIFENGCLRGECVPYFSLLDLSNVTNENEDDSKVRRFCKSYYAYNGICQTLTNIYSNDTSKCKYRNRYNEIFELDSECGFDGKTYCKEYSGRVADKYITMLKIMFINNTNCQNRNDSRLTLCRKDIMKKEDKSVIERVRFFNQTQVRYDNEYKMPTLFSQDSSLLDENATAIINIIFPYYNKTHTDEVKRECPIFKCEEKNETDVKNYKTCLRSSTTGINDTNVTLIKDICNETEFCSINGSIPLMLMQGKAMQGHCEPIINSVSKKRYPGEICKIENEVDPCVYGSCTCNNTDCSVSRCKGKERGEECNSTLECSATLYCNEEHKCQDQLGRDSQCNDSTECKNKYLCFNRTCIDYFSLHDGDTIINPNDTDAIPLEYFCKYGTVNYENKTCYSLYNESNDENLEFDECIQGQKCYYKTNPWNITVTKICECGFNNLGKAYCPLPHNRQKALWHKYFEALKSKFNNKCHTLNRFNCNKTNSYAVQDISFYSHYLEKGHLFYKSVKCAVAVLSENYIQVKSILMLIIISLLL